MGADQQQSIDIVNIVVVINIIVGDALSILYLSTRSPIKREGFSLTCAHPCINFIFKTIVVIMNVIIVIDR